MLKWSFVFFGGLLYMFLVYVSYWSLIEDLKGSVKGFTNKKINSLRSLERASEDVNDK